jgi:hypothetical protein
MESLFLFADRAHARRPGGEVNDPSALLIVAKRAKAT